MTSAITDPDKDIIVLVEIFYGTSVLRLTDAHGLPATPPMGEFLPCPTLSVTLAPYSGAFENRTSEIEFDYVSTGLSFGLSVTSGRAFAPIRVVVWQLIKNPTSDKLRKLFVGNVVSATRNPGGKQGILSLACASVKTRTQRECGIVSNNQCEWTFGDPKTCTVNISALVESGLITSITRNVVTITGLSAHVDRYWHKGYVEIDDVRVSIREWISGTSFILNSLVPIQWEETVIASGSIAVSVTPGCDLRPNTCRGVWNNLPNIMNIGVAVPTYNPFFEDAL